MCEPGVYAYPAVFTINGKSISFSFPDLGIDDIPIPEDKLPTLIDAAAEVLGQWLTEAFIIGNPLPEATPLEALPLKENQKGVWIQVIEA